MSVSKIILFLVLIQIVAICAYSQTNDVCITSQPKPELPPNYGTLDAQVNVMLRVEFLADGKIGSVAVVLGSMKSLADLAVVAAKKIEFIPKKIDGKPVDTHKVIHYFYSWDGFWRIMCVPHVYYCSPKPWKSQTKTSKSLTKP